MSVKAMVFVDGSWLYHNRKTIVNVASTDDFEIDYEKLPHLIAEVLGDKLDIDVDIVRTCYFGVIAINKPGYNPTKQRAFYDYLSERCYFETELHSIDFRQPPTSRLDERCVEIALASSMMYYAAMPGAFDVAVLLGGDLDYLPLLRRVRSLGKRVQLVALHNTDKRIATSEELLRDATLYDFPPIYLDAHTEALRHQREEKTRACGVCAKEEVTSWTGTEFCCSACRDKVRRKTRTCDSCGKEEETSWSKPYFYCISCRRSYRGGSADPAAATTTEVESTVDEDEDQFAPLDEFDPAEEQTS